VNIHPTKTEIKFENEQAIWMIITATIKEAIRKVNAVPSLEFDQEDAIEMPVYNRKNTENESPKINLNPSYNPFREQTPHHAKSNYNWDKLYPDYNRKEENVQGEMPQTPSDIFPEEKKDILTLKGKYLITTMKSGICIIDQRRAHIRILFDDYMLRIKQKRGISQGVIFPEIISFTPKEATVLPCLLDDLAYIGFDLSDLGNNSYSINGTPAGLELFDPVETLQDMADKVLETGCEIKEEISEALSLTLARKAAIPYGKFLSEEEASSLTARLFASSTPNYTPDGKSIIYMLSDDELEKKFR
jgi:DNA mismatch repair protein MutL